MLRRLGVAMLVAVFMTMTVGMTVFVFMLVFMRIIMATASHHSSRRNRTYINPE